MKFSEYLKISIIILIFVFNQSIIFSSEVLSSDYYNDRQITPEYVDSLFNIVISENRFVYNLDTSLFYNLPVGIVSKNSNNPDYAILIDEVVLYQDRAIFSASMLITNPVNGEKLAFAARDIEFTYKGGLSGVIRLELINENNVTFCKDINLYILKGSYVECDCNGFKSLHLKGKFELS